VPTKDDPMTDVTTLQEEVNAHPFWYHTIDVAPGVTTPGWFDLRRVVDKMPWPDVKGKRCLDIGTYDGFLAFEMERRGAAEVVAIDIEDHDRWDWPPDARPEVSGIENRTAGFRGPKKGDGFRLASRLLNSKVDWRPLSIYDLDPATIGTFDVITCGTLLLHLRDPIRALEAIRSVCTGFFLSSEQLELWLTLLHRGRPVYRLNGSGEECQWWLANARGHYQMLYSAGFEIVGKSRPYVVEFNVHPKPPNTPSNVVRRTVVRALTGSSHPGIFHRALLGRPRV
jgi:tRNA (mo5U34)-methyltransferase